MFATSWWAPAVACGVDCNAKLCESTLALNREWQDFASRRMKEDMDLLQNLSRAKTPNAVWSAYAGFWQKFIDDYTHEQGTLAKLAGTLVSNGVLTTQKSLEAATTMSPLSKAA
jgi:hypothetical protein